MRKGDEVRLAYLLDGCTYVSFNDIPAGGFGGKDTVPSCFRCGLRISQRTGALKDARPVADRK